VRIRSWRQGIGKKLLSFLLEAYPQHALSLDVNLDNDRAVAFYKKMGFKIKRCYMEGPDGE
jgi:ribosomal protein S18 acetylase RimI-like enzyme